MVFTKNHDFQLDVPQDQTRRYLVQWRGFAASVVSNFELYVRNGNADSEASFRRFVSDQVTHYLGFTEKWVTSDFSRGEGVLLLRYEGLLAAPGAALAQAVRHLAPDHEPDQGRIQEVVSTVDGQRVAEGRIEVVPGAGVYRGRDVQEFRYYSPELFDLIGRLRLPRAAVERCHREVTGREVDEAGVLELQTCSDVVRLREVLARCGERSGSPS